MRVRGWVPNAGETRPTCRVPLQQLSTVLVDCDEFEEWGEENLPHTQKHHNHSLAISTSV